MPLSRVFDYGTCPCGGEHNSGMIPVTIHRAAGEPIVLSVPQGTCPLCGSRVYKAQVLERVEAITAQIEAQNINFSAEHAHEGESALPD